MSLVSSRCKTMASSEQALLIRLEKQVLVLSQMPRKNMIESKSSQKSLMLNSGNSRLMMSMMLCPCIVLISQASAITSSLILSNALISLPASWTILVTLLASQILTFSIFTLDLMVMSSMQSLMAILALSDTMFRICLLFTKSDFRMLGMMSFQQSDPAYTLSRSFFWGLRNSLMRLFSTRYRRNCCSSSPNRGPFSFLRWINLRIYLQQSVIWSSGSALLMIMITPYLMSLKVLKDLSRFLVRRGSLSALASEMWDQSISKTIFTLWYMSSSFCTKKELEISYSSPLLSLKPGQSQNAKFSMYTRVGIEVSEYLSWPILMTEAPSVTSLGLRPSHRTTSWLPARQFMMVLLPTPVSPTTMMASLAYQSLGMALMPFLISSFILSRLSLPSVAAILQI